MVDEFILQIFCMHVTKVCYEKFCCTETWYGMHVCGKSVVLSYKFLYIFYVLICFQFELNCTATSYLMFRKVLSFSLMISQ
jgi:hypothetical protein